MVGSILPDLAATGGGKDGVYQQVQKDIRLVHGQGVHKWIYDEYWWAVHSNTPTTTADAGKSENGSPSG